MNGGHGEIDDGCDEQQQCMQWRNQRNSVDRENVGVSVQFSSVQYEYLYSAIKEDVALRPNVKNETLIEEEG